MKSINKKKICFVVSTYNMEITKKTLNLSKKTFQKAGIKKLDVFYVPGSFEIPVVISKLIKKYDGFVAIGCIIKGETNNFDLISYAITNSIMNLSINNKKPIGNSIITVFKKKQAINRTNKGYEAAVAVIDVLKNEPKRI